MGQNLRRGVLGLNWDWSKGGEKEGERAQAVSQVCERGIKLLDSPL